MTQKEKKIAENKRNENNKKVTANEKMKDVVNLLAWKGKKEVT